jgi:hypothetical protein
MMKTGRIVNGVMVSLAAFGFLLPQPLVAGTPAPASPVVDVALRDGGVLIGQVVDGQGAAMANVPVSLKAEQHELAVAKTSKEGYFKFKGVRGGVYQLTAAEGHGIYRVWSPGTAPPAAEEGALLVNSDDVVRGQSGGGLKGFLTNPLVIAGVVATAVAVPVAIHNSHHSSPSSP